MSRYRNRKIAKNNEYENEEIFESRGVKTITQYTTPEYKNPTEEDLLRIKYTSHYWATGDRYFKLAQKHYNDYSLWYVIALFNRKPTESHVEVGDIIKIPISLADAMQVVG